MTSTTLDKRLVQAICILAGQDEDFASSENGIGYNKPDSHFGHALAATPVEAWTPMLARSAWVMVRKYRGQLASFGLDPNDFEPPVVTETTHHVRWIDAVDGLYIFHFTYHGDLISNVKQIPGRRWQSDTKTWTVPFSGTEKVRAFAQLHQFTFSNAALEELAKEHEAVTSTGLGSVIQKGPRFILSTEYNAELVAAIREIPGRKWDGVDKVWTVPISSVRAIINLVERFDLVAPALDEVPDCDPRIIPSIDVSAGEFRIDFSYDRDLIERVRDLPGAEWDRRRQVYTVPLEAAVEVFEFALAVEAEINESALGVLDRAKETMARIAESEARDAEITILGLGGELLPFQRAGVAYALKSLGYIQQIDGTWSKQ